ncbi:hypothetical protein GEMRC1_005198 [Eukaryota sp. GEM-RC1]
MLAFNSQQQVLPTLEVPFKDEADLRLAAVEEYIDSIVDDLDLEVNLFEVAYDPTSQKGRYFICFTFNDCTKCFIVKAKFVRGDDFTGIINTLRDCEPFVLCTATDQEANLAVHRCLSDIELTDFSVSAEIIDDSQMQVCLHDTNDFDIVFCEEYDYELSQELSDSIELVENLPIQFIGELLEEEEDRIAAIQDIIDQLTFPDGVTATVTAEVGDDNVRTYTVLIVTTDPPCEATAEVVAVWDNGDPDLFCNLVGDNFVDGFFVHICTDDATVEAVEANIQNQIEEFLENFPGADVEVSVDLEEGKVTVTIDGEDCGTFSFFLMDADNAQQIIEDCHAAGFFQDLDIELGPGGNVGLPQRQFRVRQAIQECLMAGGHPPADNGAFTLIVTDGAGNPNGPLDFTVRIVLCDEDETFALIGVTLDVILPN